MLQILLIIVGAILLTIGLVKLVDKFIPKKLKPVLMIALWLLIAFLGYNTYTSIYAPIQFNKVKTERFKTVIKGIKDIRSAQLAHRTVTGRFASRFEDLVTFVDTAEFTITQRSNSTVIDEEKNKLFGLTSMTKEIVVIDTLGTVPVKDSLFKGSEHYKTMMNLPKGIGKSGKGKYQLESGFIVLNDINIPVFECFVKKDSILYDQDKNLLKQENEVLSPVVGVQGDAIKVGSMSEAQTIGNWAKLYDTTE